jgi:hypothetical protein
MKNARNKYANATQANETALAELKEKIKILQNEVEILQNESQARDRALTEEVRIHQGAKKQRDFERLENNKKKAELRAKKEEFEQQQLEIAKLNAIVNAAETSMSNLRKDYARGMDSRNLTGIQLIDRNDECAILTYKENMQAAILKKGDDSLRQKEQEQRDIQHNLAEMRRRIEVARRLLPSLQVYASTRRTLQDLELKLAQEQQQTNELCAKLETPAYGDGEALAGEKTEARCRMLGGMDPEPEQLAAKTELLEERLNDKKEQLLEKELVLDEVTSLTDKLRMQAAESRGPTLMLAQKVNETQSQIREVIRKMMATVSELSMYQATTMKLENQKLEIQQTLQEARERISKGQPPTEAATKEWFRLERHRMRRKEIEIEKQRTSEALQDTATGVLARTTAIPRPNSYITETLGLPKPYGTHQPFRPTLQGASMRHIRNPVPKDIVL